MPSYRKANCCSSGMTRMNPPKTEVPVFFYCQQMIQNDKDIALLYLLHSNNKNDIIYLPKLNLCHSYN